MNIIEKNKEIPEMYILRHKHDIIVPEHGFNYTENLLKRSTSKILFNNKILSGFLDKINDMLVVMIDSVQPIRNIFFYTHTEYYNKHGK